MSNIALDYDGTITTDFDLWVAIYWMLRAAGHTVYVVTGRYEDKEPIRSNFPGLIYYTGRCAKKPWCERHGLNIDIWIDDCPQFINKDSYHILEFPPEKQSG